MHITPNIATRWSTGTHFNFKTNDWVWIEKERSRTKAGALRAKKRIYKVRRVRPGSCDAIQRGGEPDPRQWVLAHTYGKSPSDSRTRRMFTLERFLELFEPFKNTEAPDEKMD